MTPGLPLEAYRDLIALDRPTGPTTAVPAHDALHVDVQAAAAAVLEAMGADPALARAGLAGAVPRGHARQALRAVLTVRDPAPLPPRASTLLDALLHAERLHRGHVEAAALPTVARTRPSTRYPSAAGTALWQGDITTLRADVVVNAANSALLGCFRPFHACVDNALHAAAGPRLRDDCAAIIDAQGAPEPVGTAKITRGHHLAARYVAHTVGPAVHGAVGDADARALASCYRSCLDLAVEVHARTVAFCSISTGVFGYPGPAAARVALAAVDDWLGRHRGALDLVVLDVFTAEDLGVYHHVLDTW